MKIGVSVKSLFFDSPAVMRAVDTATRKTLAQQGRYLQKVARNSIKKAPMDKVEVDDFGHIGSMSSQERQKYYIAANIAQREGRPIPKRMRRSRGSPPGTPPYSRTGLLKRMLFYSYDPSSKSVVVGPSAAGPKTADVLEYGGTVKIKTGGKSRTIRVKPRPTMRLAYAKSKPRLTEFWRNSVK